MSQIQCTCTDFWCIWFPRPTRSSTMDKYRVQYKCIDLSYFFTINKCKFINLIHIWQKNNLLMFITNDKLSGSEVQLNMRITNKYTWQKWISRCKAYANTHTSKAPRAVQAQYMVDIFNTLRVFWSSTNWFATMRSVWIQY